ncbi:uncharacterized protein LOC121859734 isoform X2 [Homarus americanus]|uniref:uncharacterized protein LOC121859734 isoform X2 n=1 Tax=Homarus americanus TaxID=6706 RepID=UPI001C475171|nr:uncharacterized protein LOC121859734 isoform X2 [Homarus americanus]
MQAAGLLKDKNNHENDNDQIKKVNIHRAMAKPVLVASITQDDSNVATIIKEAKDGMSWITTKVKLPNGKSAWGGKVGDKKRASDAQRRWMNKNKVGDAAGGGTLEKRPDGEYRQTGVVNIVLYVGLGLFALGLTITFVGIGEHGFKSPELRLIGPSLIGCGFLFCLLRLFFCSPPACCRKNKPLDEKALLSPSRETLAEDATTEGQQEQGQQQVPHPLEKHEEEDDQQEALRITSKSARRIHSTIPNFIDDEGEDDAALGLHVEYMDEISEGVTPRQRLGSGYMGSRPSSSQSRVSTASKVPRLPDIHTMRRQNSEIVLNPAALERSGD